MTITTIVTALFIAAFFCLSMALLLTRAERKQTYSWQRPFRPAEPDTGDDEYPSQACMTAPTQQPYQRVPSDANGEPVTNLVTSAARPERSVGVRSDELDARIAAIEQDVKLLHRLRLNHARRLTQCEDLIDLLNRCEQEAGAEPELEHTQPLPVVADMFRGIDLHRDWHLIGSDPMSTPTLYAYDVREIASWRVEAEDGRLDLML